MRASFHGVDFPNHWDAARPGICNFGSDTQTSSSTNTIDPWLKGILSSSANRANTIANIPFQPFGGEGAAGLSQNQNLALQGAQNLNGAGAPALDMAVNGAGGLLNFNPATLSASYANYSPAAAAGIDRGAVRNVSAGDAIGGMADWTSPYTDSVVNASLGDLEQSRQRAIGSNEDAAIAARAFGGSRHGVADALTNEAFSKTAANTAASLRNQGFTTAAGLAQNDAARRLQADTTNQGMDYNVGAQNAGFTQQTNLSNAQGGYNASAFNAGANNDASARNQAADLSAAGVRSSAAGLLGNLGNSQFNNGLGYVNALGNTGAVDQATRQAGNTFDYQEFLRQMNYPYQGQTLINQSLGLLPRSGTTTTTAPSNATANTFNGLLGLGQTAASLGWNPFGD